MSNKHDISTPEIQRLIEKLDAQHASLLKPRVKPRRNETSPQACV
jgi:hypothetical protein